MASTLLPSLLFWIRKCKRLTWVPLQAHRAASYLRHWRAVQSWTPESVAAVHPTARLPVVRTRDGIAANIPGLPNNFDIEGYAPDKVVEVKSTEDDTTYTLYLWVAPLKKS